MERITGLGVRIHTTFNSSCYQTFKKTDAWFAPLLMGEWALAIACAVFTSPTTYKGMEPILHDKVWTALLVGGLVVFVAASFALVNAGEEITRHVVAIAQVLMGLLIVYLGEGKFDIFLLMIASLGLLAFYRDWRVLVTAAIMICMSTEFIAATHQLL